MRIWRTLQRKRNKGDYYMNDGNLLSIQTILAVFISFGVSAALGPVVIPFLTRLKVSQTERVDGVESHLKKTGTPTMGGVMILAGILVGSIPFIGKYPRIVPVLFLTVGFGLIGFVDDYLKVVKRKSDGLLPKQKMLLQIILTTVFVVYLWLRDPACLDIMIPFTGGYTLAGTAVRVIATPILYLAVIGTDNGTNFTDGLDGLSSGVTTVVAAFLLLASVRTGGAIEPVCGAMAGALMGFLIWNAHPAKVFMGDTGSLALGGFVAGSAYMLQMPLFILLFGLIYLVEVLSVIIQVAYFRRTGGKRFFRMAPIHHHFEKGGWSETKIVTVFTIVTILLCIIAYAAM